MIPAAIKKLLARDEADLDAEVATLKEEQRAYNKSLVAHVNDAHDAVDRLVNDARASFAATFGDLRNLPTDSRHPWVPGLVQTYTLASEAFAKQAHAAVDEAARAGTYDTTPPEKIAADLRKFADEIAARELALRRKVAEAEAEASKLALDRLDAHHDAVSNWMSETDSALLTVAPVLTETAFFLPARLRVSLAVLAASGVLQVHHPDAGAYARIGQLFAKYANQDPDWTDLELVWLAEATGIRRIATLDVADFSVYRIHGRKRFELELLR